jgi:hypothetical protein
MASKHDKSVGQSNAATTKGSKMAASVKAVSEAQSGGFEFDPDVLDDKISSLFGRLRKMTKRARKAGSPVAAQLAQLEDHARQMRSIIGAIPRK